MIKRFIPALKPFLTDSQLAIFLLGITSGFPLTLVISLMSFWLRDFGIEKSTIGLFALATLPYSLKFLWAPVIDKVPLGPFSRIFGQRRSWFGAIATLLAVALGILSRLDPQSDLGLIAVVGVAIGFLSASLDIVIDAYRIEILDTREMAHGATSVTFGYRAGNLAAGYGGLQIADSYGWGPAILALTLLLLPGCIALIIKGDSQPVSKRGPKHRLKQAPYGQEESHLSPPSGTIKEKRLSGFKEKLKEAVIDPFREFMSRSHWFAILAFIFFFKLGDAVTAIMTGPLLIDLQFSKAEIANANKLVGTVALWAGIALGSVLYSFAGVYRSLFLTGILMMLTNGAFAFLALSGNTVWIMAAVIGAENFATGLGTTVLVAYLSGLCNVAFTATQYALLNSLANQGRTIFGSMSGFMVDSLGWVGFFITSTFLAVPGLLLLYYLMQKKVETSSRVTSPATNPRLGEDQA